MQHFRSGDPKGIPQEFRRVLNFGHNLHGTVLTPSRSYQYSRVHSLLSRKLSVENSYHRFAIDRRQLAMGLLIPVSKKLIGDVVPNLHRFVLHGFRQQYNHFQRVRSKLKTGLHEQMGYDTLWGTPHHPPP
jgi:hypothetical protein